MGGSGIPGAVRCDIGIKIFQQKTDMACPVMALITFVVGAYFFDPDVNNRKTFAVIVDKEKSECYTCYQ